MDNGNGAHKLTPSGASLVTLILCLAVSSNLHSGQTSGNMGGTSGMKSGPTTITGCLATLGNHYTLTDSNGTVYQLSDEANKLTKHVGHEVKITGMPGVRTTDTTVSGTESTAKETPVIRVKTVTQVADKCN